MTGIVMFLAALFMLAIGFSVAFTFGAIAVIFGLIGGMVESFGGGNGFMGGLEIFKETFNFMPYRIYSIMENKILIAVPLFVFMGIILQKTKLAERLLESMAFLFGEIRGGVAISTVLVGALLAASTGVVGASVVAMGVMSLPVMLKYNYNYPGRRLYGACGRSFPRSDISWTSACWRLYSLHTHHLLREKGLRAAGRRRKRHA